MSVLQYTQRLKLAFPKLQHVVLSGGLADDAIVDGATGDVGSFLAPSSILLDPQNSVSSLTSL